MEGIQTTIKHAGPGDSIAVIKVGGYIDTTTSSELERSLGSLLKKNQYRIIIDLGDVDYISSAGWGIFISEIKLIKENSGDLKLVRMIPEVYEVFELLEFNYILKAYDTVDEAVVDFVKEGGLDAAPKAQPKAEPKPVSQATEEASDEESRKEVMAAVEEDDQPETRKTKQVADSKDDPLNIVDRSELDIEEKIKLILKENPDFNAWKIKKFLNTSEYGLVDIGWFEVRKYLKDLKL